jgi:hypothetical protein
LGHGARANEGQREQVERLLRTRLPCRPE